MMDASTGCPAESVAGTRRTYPVGSDRDVRLRAVLGTHRLELGVSAIEEGLRAIRFVGRTLRLRYQRRDQRFFWRQRVRDEQGRTVAWEDIGARVPDEVRRGLWVETRSRIDGAEEWMAMRQDGRSVLLLTNWLVAHGLDSAATVIEMAWEGEGKVARLHWTFRADGAIQRTKNWAVGKRLVTAYGRTTAAVWSAIDVRKPRGPYTGAVEDGLVKPHQAVDERLRGLAELLREQQARIRLYRRTKEDTWCFREVVSGRGTRHVPVDRVEDRARELAAQPQSQVVEALRLLGKRGEIRRLLRIIAELTEGAVVWPGGQWTVVARDSNRRAWWCKVASREGILGRRYRAGTEEMCVRQAAEEGEMGELENG